jgi:hypothetical protein
MDLKRSRCYVRDPEGYLRVAAVASLVLGWFTSLVIAYTQKQESINPAAIQHLDKFQGTSTLLDMSGKSRNVRVALRQWTILGEQRMFRNSKSAVFC